MNQPILSPKAFIPLLILTLLVSLGIQHPASAMQTETTTNVLIIGHSWTSKSGDHLNTLTAALGDLWANQVIHGSYSLKDQWNDPKQMALIRAELDKGIYDYAAIMDFAGSAGNESGPEKPLTYDALFDELFRSYGVQTIILEPWAYITHPGMINLIASNTAFIAQTLGVPVAPIGDAFALANDQMPGLALTKNADDSHPNPAGAYLRDLVIYATIMNKHPAELASEFGISSEEEAQLKDIAWEAVVNWNNGALPQAPSPSATSNPTVAPEPSKTPAPVTNTPAPTASPTDPPPTETRAARPTAEPGASVAGTPATGSPNPPLTYKLGGPLVLAILLGLGIISSAILFARRKH